MFPVPLLLLRNRLGCIVHLITWSNSSKYSIIVKTQKYWFLDKWFQFINVSAPNLFIALLLWLLKSSSVIFTKQVVKFVSVAQMGFWLPCWKINNICWSLVAYVITHKILLSLCFFLNLRVWTVFGTVLFLEIVVLNLIFLHQYPHFCYFWRSVIYSHGSWWTWTQLCITKQKLTVPFEGFKIAKPEWEMTVGITIIIIYIRLGRIMYQLYILTAFLDPTMFFFLIFYTHIDMHWHPYIFSSQE